MEGLSKRLAAREDDIRKIMEIAGTLGASVGIWHKGEQYTYNYGYRDVQAKLPTTERTIYAVCSLTKAQLAAVAATLVEDGTLMWDTLVKELLPDFSIHDETMRNSCTIGDLLSHRTGMSQGDFYLGSDNNLIIHLDDAVKFVSNQKQVFPFRASWDYNNLGYELAGVIIGKAAGSSWATLMKDRLFQPLGLQRTSTNYPPIDEEDVAKAYEVLDDGTPTEIHGIQATEDTFGGASAGVRSCVSDLLVLYKAWMDSAVDQFATGKTSTPGLPIVRATDLMTAKVPMAQPSFREASYAYGWARVQLPNTLGHIGSNPPLMPDRMPVVGKGSQEQLMWCHQGSLPGALHAVFVLPETDTIIVVLTNALALHDCADWIAQLLREEIIDTPKRNDYVELAKVSAGNTLRWYPETIRQLQQEQKPNTTAKPLQDYVGTYWNEPRCLKIVVTMEDEQLYWAAQRLNSERFVLWHYQDDTFSWLQPRDDPVSRARWVDQPPAFWKIRFHTDSADKVTSLRWAYDSDLPEGEGFFKSK